MLSLKECYQSFSTQICICIIDIIDLCEHTKCIIWSSLENPKFANKWSAITRSTLEPHDRIRVFALGKSQLWMDYTYYCFSELIRQFFCSFHQKLHLMNKAIINSRRTMPKPTVTIGYYELRGRAQVPRLLCEFLGVNYQDKIYSYQEWRTEKLEKSKKG